jgi:hypothetical protein
VSGQIHAPAALPGGKIPGTQWVGGWEGPRAGLDAEVAKGEIPCSCRELNPGRPVRSLVNTLTELFRLLSERRATFHKNCILIWRSLRLAAGMPVFPVTFRMKHSRSHSNMDRTLDLHAAQRSEGSGMVEYNLWLQSYESKGN